MVLSGSQFSCQVAIGKLSIVQLHICITVATASDLAAALRRVPHVPGAFQTEQKGELAARECLESTQDRLALRGSLMDMPRRG